MQTLSRRTALSLMIAGLAACGQRSDATDAHSQGPTDINRLITKYAHLYDVPEDLVHRVVQRESRYNADARNGPYLGLMQIHPKTAQGMGYSGPPEGLLNPDTNLRYAVKYLRGAWLVSRGNRDQAVMWYAKGYYYEAKRMGLLKETGLT